MKIKVNLGNETIGKTIEKIIGKTIIDLIKVSESSHAMTIYNQIWKVVFEDGSIKYVQVQIDFEKSLMIISL